MPRTVVVITPPYPVVSLDEAKSHLRVDFTDDDLLIEASIAAATALLDGPDGWLGRAIGEQELELRLDGFPTCEDEGRLPFPPLIAIDSVIYVDADGAEQIVDSSVWRLLGGGSAAPTIALAYGQTWPTARAERESVRIAYTAGYPAGGIPAPIRAAILLLTGHLYENREAVTSAQSYKIPVGVDDLAGAYRLMQC